MKVVVITGGIGSGKSEACRFIESEYGWPVYSADDRVKELYRDSPTLLESIEDALGARFRDAEGNFKPSELASVIFSDTTALEKTEALVFPELLADFEQWKIQHKDSSHVILESATILEKPQLKGIGDCTILIDAPLHLRSARAVQRDRAEIGEIHKRISNQKLMNAVSQKFLIPDVDYIICNDSSMDDFRNNLIKVVDIIA